jgi:ribulose-phosphate 3-epimerase
MREIMPAILEKDYKEIKNKLSALRDLAKTIHLDFCDGQFVPNQTWPYATGGLEDFEFLQIINEEEGLPYWQEFDFEFDMLTLDAVANFDIYAKLGPKRMIFHLAAQNSVEEFSQFIEGLDIYFRDNIEIGLAFRPSEDMEVVKKLSHKVDFLHAMGSDRVGYQGEPFQMKTLENVRMLKEELPGIVISVDIGVNLENATEILDAGVDRLVVGSSIWKSGDPLGALENFQSLL